MNIKMMGWAGLIGILILVNVQRGQSRQQYIITQTGNQPRVYAVTDSIDAATGLVQAPGLTNVKENCLRCHSPKLITAKRATREGWLTTIRWMQQNQGLGDLGTAESVILDYLAKHYAPTQTGRRPALKNVVWYKLEK